MFTMKSKNKIAIYTILLFMIGCSAPVQKYTRALQPPSHYFVPIGEQIDSLLAAYAPSGTTTSIKVVAIDRNETLYERNSSLNFHPASTLKLLTAAAALYTLPQNYCFETVVYVDSNEINASSVSNIYLKGFGDPLLMPQDIDLLATQIAQHGIGQVCGDVVIDNSFFDSLYWGEGWAWDDAGDPDAPIISPLSINNNSIQVVVIPSVTIQSQPIISVLPSTSFYRTNNSARMVTNSENRTISLEWTGFPESTTLKVSGCVRTSDPVLYFTKSVPKPELFAGELFRTTLKVHELQVLGNCKKGTLPSSAVPIATVCTPLDTVLSSMLKNSNNLAAENVLKTIAAVTFGVPGTSKNGITVLYQFLNSLGIDTTTMRIVDGSGVSRYNLVNADVLMQFLTEIAHRKDLFLRLYSLLPQPCVDGTLEQRMCGTPAENNVRAKTGTLQGVSCLAGYATTADNELLAFTVMMQHFIGKAGAARSLQDSIAVALTTISRNNFIQRIP